MSVGNVLNIEGDLVVAGIFEIPEKVVINGDWKGQVEVLEILQMNSRAIMLEMILFPFPLDICCQRLDCTSKV